MPTPRPPIRRRPPSGRSRTRANVCDRWPTPGEPNGVIRSMPARRVAERCFCQPSLRGLRPKDWPVSSSNWSSIAMAWRAWRLRSRQTMLSLRKRRARALDGKMPSPHRLCLVPAVLTQRRLRHSAVGKAVSASACRKALSNDNCTQLSSRRIRANGSRRGGAARRPRGARKFRSRNELSTAAHV